MKAFFGNYDLVIDEKNRLLIPVEVRRAMDLEVDGNAFYMVTGFNGRPWLWPEKQFEQHASGRGSMLAPSEEDLEFDQLVFGCSVRLELDRQGRVLIPEKAMKESGIVKEITLSSVRDHLEIWDRASWLTWRQDLQSRRAEIMKRANQVRQMPQLAAEPEKK